MTANEQQLKQLLKTGFEALTRGHLSQAAECCKKAIAIKPDLPQVHFLIGLTALEGQDRVTAFQAFGSVTKLDPGNAAAWAQLARLFMTEGQISRADAALEQAVAAGTTDPMVMDLIGTVYSLMGEYGVAKEQFLAAVSLKPAHTPFLLNLANNLIYHGDTNEAIGILQKIISIEPDSPQAHWSLAGAAKASDTLHIEEMQQCLAKPGLHPRAKAFYYYAIGKEYEDMHNWPRAIEAFSSGAGARRGTVEFDEVAEIEMFAFLKEHFTESWLADCGAGFDDASPIFVLGQPRTGTTLIERIIGSHSKVHAAGELQQLGLGVRRLTEYRDPKRFSVKFFEASLSVEPARLGSLYIDTTRRVRGDTPHFVDKLPQNYLMIPLILAALPNAKIVHLQRDPVDACFASFKQLFADAYLHSYDQQEMARHHARYLDLMSVWRTRFPGRFLDVSYEATVADLEPGARRLLDFLGLDFEPACLAFHEQPAAVSTASAVQVREAAHTRSVGRWKQYESELAPMIDALAAAGVKVDGDSGASV